VSASTQNQALAALLFLYQAVLEQDLPWLDEIVRAKRPHRVPVVLTRREVQDLLDHMEGTPRLVATLLYGAGLRLLEALQLRVKDVDLEARVLTVRSGKGDRDRPAILPDSLCQALEASIEGSLAQHRQDAAPAGSSSPKRSSGSTRALLAARRGSGSSRPRAPTATRRRVRSAATTCTRP
jgi:site-specific recombinase XerD